MSRQRPPVPPPVSDDEELYRREYASVRPLPSGPTRVPLVPKEARPAGGSADELRPSEPPQLHVERSGDRVLAAAPSVSRETVRVLGRGDRPAEATCDLHGLRAEAARTRLLHFIEDSTLRGRRRVLIVCGRGQHSGAQGPVLRELAVAILAGPSLGRHVLAFTSAAPGQGGAGALAVLLRDRPPARQ
jgi:DNA-nicking Smr family endonuclease